MNFPDELYKDLVLCAEHVREDWEEHAGMHNYHTPPPYLTNLEAWLAANRPLPLEVGQVWQDRRFGASKPLTVVITKIEGNVISYWLSSPALVYVQDRVHTQETQGVRDMLKGWTLVEG